MGQSIRFAGACPNCSRALFVAIAPGCLSANRIASEPTTDPTSSSVKCYGCGAHWAIPSEVRSTAETPILHPPLSSLDQRVEFLLQAADEQLATPASGANPAAGTSMR
jgi:hypothetical protein